MNGSLRSTGLSKALAITGMSLVLGCLFDYFFYGKLPGISFPLFILSVLAVLFGLSVYVRQPLARPSLWLIVPLVFFSAMVAVRASPLLTLLNVGASFSLLLLVARLSSAGKLASFQMLDYLKVLLVPLDFIKPLRQALAEIVALKRTYKKQPAAAQIAKGVAITLPVLIVFVMLFASADLIFRKYISELLHVQFSPSAYVRTTIILLVTLVFTGAYSYIFGPRPAASPRAERGHSYVIGQLESAILLGSVNLLFFLFILVQLAYLFGGQSNITVQGFTYAEYARKGFFELIAVAVISFAMLWAADKTVAKTERGHSMKFRLLSGLLIVQVILIMASAFKRLYLYEQAYGFTALRLYSHAFVVLLAAIFILLLIKIVKNQAESTFALPAFIAVVVFLAAMNLLNPDAFIARQNVVRYGQTGKLDVSYLSGLSDDAVPELRKAANDTSGKARTELVQQLYVRTHAAGRDRHWQSWNLSHRQAEAVQARQ